LPKFLINWQNQLITLLNYPALSTVSSINCDRCRQLDLAVPVCLQHRRESKPIDLAGRWLA